MVGARCIPAQHGGLETAVEELSAELATQGHDVTAYVDGSTVTANTHRGFRVHGVPALRTKHTHTISQVLASVPTSMRARPDVTHFHGVGPGVLAGVPRLAQQPTVLTVQGLDWQREKWSGAARETFRLAAQLSLRSPNAIIAVSRALQMALGQLGFESVYIPNGVRPARPEPAGHVLQELSVEPGEYLLFVGRLVPEKGLHTLLAAHRQLEDGLPLVIAGGGSASYATAYEQQLRSEAGPGVVFAGFRSGSELAELYANARCFVLPSTLEGLPLSLLEAMSYGLPVVHSDIPQNTEVTDPDGGRAFRTGDVDDLRLALIEVLQNKDKASAMSRSGLEIVESRYGWKAICQATEDLYSRVMSA